MPFWHIYSFARCGLASARCGIRDTPLVGFFCFGNERDQGIKQTDEQTPLPGQILCPSVPKGQVPVPVRTHRKASKSDGLQPSSDGLQPNSEGLQPTSVDSKEMDESSLVLYDSVHYLPQEPSGPRDPAAWEIPPNIRSSPTDRPTCRSSDG